MKGNRDPRIRFFNEQGSMMPPFMDHSWRGCVLDRDRFDNTRLPELLFSAIVGAAGSNELLISRYSPDSIAIETIVASWSSYQSYALAPANWALEYVVFDTSERWAVLADADATLLGAAPDVAERIDQRLAVQGTSLAQLTDADFPGLRHSQRPGAAYLLAVTGE